MAFQKLAQGSAKISSTVIKKYPQTNRRGVAKAKLSELKYGYGSGYRAE